MEENLKEKMRSYQPIPDSEVWNRVQHTLLRRTLIRRATTVALISIVVGGAFLWAVTRFSNKAEVPPADNTTYALNQPSQQVPLSADSSSLVQSEASCSQLLSAAHDAVAASTLQQSVTASATNFPVKVDRAVSDAHTPVAATTETEPLSLASSSTSTAVLQPSSAAAPSVSTQSANPSTTAQESVSQPQTNSSDAPSAHQTVAPKVETSPITPDVTSLSIPNAFAPADPNLVNRTFRIVSNTSITSFSLYIYNRGGRLVYHTTDINAFWDGTHNGTDVPQGAYVYVIHYSDQEGAPQILKGTVTLIR